MKTHKIETTIDEIIELAWSDIASFDDIDQLTGMKESDVIAVMRDALKPRSFRLWRKRVSGRATKHSKKLKRMPVKIKHHHSIHQL